MKQTLSIVLVEDDPNDAKLLALELDNLFSATITRVQTEEELRTALGSTAPDIILSDYNLPAFDGMRALGIRQQIAPHIPFILVTGSINEATAVDCMKAGADDYIIKEHLNRLVPAILAALKKHQIIKEKQEIEIALRNSEERFRRALDNSPVIISYQDRELRYTWMYHPTSYFTAANLKGKTDYDIMLPDEAANLTRIKQRVINEGEPIREEVKITFNGTLFYYDLTVEPLHDGAGEIEGITCTLVDITEQKSAESALHESEKRFKSLFQDNLAVMFLIDPDNGALVDVNEAAVQYYGWSRKELLSMTIYQINTLPPHEVKKEIENARNRKRIQFEFRHKKSDGSISDVEVFTSKIEIGKKEFLHTIVHDIGERKKTEEKLLLHTTALQSAANAIVITDTDGIILSVNPAFTTLTGFMPGDVIGKKTNILKSGVQTQSFYRTLWETVLSGKVWRNEIVNKRNDGTLYTEEMTVTPVINEQGIITNFISIKQDVSEQRNLQQQLFQSQKIESIGTLAGGIAHDFNNILGIILAYSSLIERTTMDPEKLNESAKAISKAVHRGATLVKQILTFARKSDVSFNPVSVTDMIRELKGMLQETFPKIITIHEVIPQTVPQVHADQAQLHQAVLNLCVNARDAMPKGGNLTITVEVLGNEIVAKKYPRAIYGKYICISVADTGTGIDAETKKRIFDPFYTTKEVGKGTGMGLAVVSGVAQSHHGFVDVESTVGVGTTFFLYIPVIQDDVQPNGGQQHIRKSVKGGKETILLVEDEELLRGTAEALFLLKGYTVLLARDGEEAVEIFRKKNKTIDLVFTDMGLPRLTGVEEFWELKKINPEVKILLTSGFLDPEIKSDLFLGGAKGFIQKPYLAEDVLIQIREILDQQ